MSHTLFNITAPIRFRFAVVSGTWNELEESDYLGLGYGWEFTPASTSEPFNSEASEEPDDLGHTREFMRAPTTIPVELDPWEVRKEFLELRHDDRDALRKFLRETGEFCWINYRPLQESELWQFQAAIRQHMLRRTVSEFEVIRNRIAAHVMKMNVELDHGTLVGEVEALNTFDAMLSTIFIDRLRRLRFKVCERPDCAALYELTSRHKRKFCSYKCAHLMTVRRSRKPEKRKNKKKKQTLASITPPPHS